MTDICDVDVVVFDVLGTLVDEAEGLRLAIREASRDTAESAVERMLKDWHGHVDARQHKILRGERAYADSDAIDAEVAQMLARRIGLADTVDIERLATATHRLPPWEDAARALDRIAASLPTTALSNASDAALLALHAHAGFRWHQVVSGESVRSYKPHASLYRRAVEIANRPPRRVLMVAAHAWDLRAAQDVGMSTAYIARPVSDPPTANDRFDWQFANLDDLAAALVG